ncbi:MAG: aminoglycoside phosphotransferase family protein [Acidimicrobiia bacterium]|nr:aminoglycoside phosphotransferase family protein [Acidimicrobiia bacterium]
MSEHEQALEGGNLNPGVVRVGDTVRRSAGSWTPAVHDLLQHLADRSYPAPRPLGIDDDGREVLTFIPGECVHPDNLDMLQTDSSMRRVGRLITEYHRAQTGYVSPPDALWRKDGQDPTGSTEVIAHNDLAPWNLISGPTGWVFIDWDLAAPGRRMWDLAWALHSFVGLWPDSPIAHDDTVRRIAAFCDGAAIDHSDRPRLLDVVVERTRHHSLMLRSRAREGDAEYQRLVDDGHAHAWEQGSNHVAANRDRWASALRA